MDDLGQEPVAFFQGKNELRQKDNARKLGISFSVVNRSFNKEDSSLPSLEMVPYYALVWVTIS